MYGDDQFGGGDFAGDGFGTVQDNNQFSGAEFGRSQYGQASQGWRAEGGYAPKRRAASEPATEGQNKRLRQFVDDAAEELICPITTELPVDPVTAEDGRVYERCAIEDWIARPGELKSPTLNTPMGSRLFPAKQVRNIIEQMVRTSAISGPKAEAWSKKLAEENQVKVMRARAEGGDEDAINYLGAWYFNGEKGLAKDHKQAAALYQRGYDLGHASCTARLGVRYARGEGVEENTTYAVLLYCVAAKGGSEAGCCNLAWCFAIGRYGLPPDAREATRWFRAMESATVRDVSENHRCKAAEWLRDHAAES